MDLFLNNPKGFYVRAKKKKHSNNIREAKYIFRYTGRPVIANSRIIDYDKNTVTFKYNRHEDEKEIIEKLTSFEFIKRLIVHIHEFNFKTIRYNGIYTSQNILANFYENNDSINIDRKLSWRQLIIEDFQWDPMISLYCNVEMKLVYTYLSP